MKKLLSLILAIAMCLFSVTALANETIDTIMNATTTQAFAADPIPEEDLNTILEAGLSATSAINQQPWFFAVITDKDLMNELGGSGFGGAPAGGAPAGFDGAPEGFDAAPEGFNGAPEGAAMPEGGAAEVPALPAASGSSAAKAALGDSPAAVIVYLDESGMGVSAFDTGLACQNMFIAATALGYGAKIVSSPTLTLNGANHNAICEQLGVDPAYTAVAVLLLGKPDAQVDGVTGATTRSGIEEKVSFH